MKDGRKMEQMGGKFEQVDSRQECSGRKLVMNTEGSTEGNH